ncbi:hypothetical protein [Pseudomonas fluorescens]|uniref:hypothetical protein n=1 Tax=Pseudomonas fluorescens TaxID=294 RepID=UPI00123F735D|nr:hypothetical protein [Pseudomonas fluorescens]
MKQIIHRTWTDTILHWVLQEVRDTAKLPVRKGGLCTDFQPSKKIAGCASAYIETQFPVAAGAACYLLTFHQL